MPGEQKPKVKGNKSRWSIRPPKKKFVSRVAGLETHTFDIGNAKYAAKYKKSLNANANYVQRRYNGGPEIAKVMKDLVQPTIIVPTYPVATTGGQFNPGEVFLCQMATGSTRNQEENHAVRKEQDTLLCTSHWTVLPQVGEQNPGVKRI
jgi:hypothetical protein